MMLSLYQKRYRLRRQQGLCVRCGTVSPGKAMCPDCTNYIVDKNKNKALAKKNKEQFKNCKHPITYLSDNKRYCCICNQVMKTGRSTVGDLIRELSSLGE